MKQFRLFPSILLLTLLCAMSSQVLCAPNAESGSTDTQSAVPHYVPSASNLAARQAFREAGFGIFLHWGIYSMAGRGEWMMNNDKVNREEYAKLAEGFYPAHFNAREWVRLFKQAGAKYICFTARHHDGFSMFATKQTKYNIVDATPFKRDVVRELADACRKEGLKLHLYYSLVDWYREDYPMGERTGLDNGKDPAKGDYDHYFEFMKAQLTELLTRYGEIGCIWMDGLWNQKPGFDWRLPELYAHIHSLQPACLIANNHHQAAKEGEDIQCFERDVPGENKAGYISGEIEISRQLPLETCQTMNRTWGYSLTDQNYKSVEEIRALLEAANAKGANLLLNIGPMPSGKLPDKAVDILKALHTK